MDTLPPEWINAMPLTCQHMIAVPTSDISIAAMEMLRMDSRFKGDPKAAKVLHEIAQTYGAAALRITALKH